MVPGQALIGGPSNAGGLFVDWVPARSSGRARARRRPARAGGRSAGRTGDPSRYRSGCRTCGGSGPRSTTPSCGPASTASTSRQGPGGVVRAAYEASGFVIRRMLERTGVEGRRIVATGGGSRSVPWMQAVADATGLPVEAVAVPEGAGAATRPDGAGLGGRPPVPGRRAGPGVGRGGRAPVPAVRGADPQG